MIAAPLTEPHVDRPMPGGQKGAIEGLDEVARRAWQARKEPRLRAWVGQQLGKCGDPTTALARVQCIEDALRATVAYVHDPFQTEFMVAPKNLLCLDDGLCMRIGDCDDFSLTMAAAMMSVGLRAWIVGASYQPGGRTQHVYAAFADESGKQIRVDATNKRPVGQVAPFVREWWVDPSQGIRSDGLSGGDFVGVGKAGVMQASRAAVRFGGLEVRGFALGDAATATVCPDCSFAAPFLGGTFVGAAAVVVYATVAGIAYKRYGRGK